MAAARLFKVGDIVQLNAGGPIMTVTSCPIDRAGQMCVATVWFDKDDRECSGVYLETIVRAAKKEAAAA